MLRRLFLILLLLPVISFAETFTAGKDYEVMGDVKKSIKDKIPVTEFFSYGCPWCYRIEPALENWVKQHDGKIKFSRVPVVFHQDWSYYAKAYYAAELLGMGAKLTPALFKAIQTDKQELNSNSAMIDFFIAQGVDKDTAESAFSHSTIVDMKVSEGSAVMGRFRVNGVPAIVVNNRYKTDLQMAQNEERFFKVLDYLITLDNDKKSA